MKTSLQLDISFEQLMELVRQLPFDDKVRMSEELARDAVGGKLNSLLKRLRTDELDEQTITEEVELVRQSTYDQQKA
jgi:hypothetical protein